MNDDTPIIEIDMQKVADNWEDAECVMRREWHKKHPRRMNSILQWIIENTIAPAVFRDKKRKARSRRKKLSGLTATHTAAPSSW